jgi:hypothetical protein
MRRLNKKQTEELEELRTKLVDAAQLFNQARTELESFREDIVTEQQSYYDDRSERWQASEACEVYQEWISTWEEECAEECAEECVEYPTEMG